MTMGRADQGASWLDGLHASFGKGVAMNDKERLALYRKTLEYYADPENWKGGRVGDMFSAYETSIDEDKGQLARDALRLASED